MQLNKKERGFSFSKSGPLDMRMDPSSDLTAKDVVNNFSEEELEKIFKEYGEEPRARQTAKAIVTERSKKPIESTEELAKIVTGSAKKTKKRSPATLVFQAIRMCVNQELESIQGGVQKALQKLSPGGVIGAISFHSLEDRLVKNIFRDASLPIKKIVGEKEETYLPMLKLLTKKPLIPSMQEIKKNPRSRSAKLRFAEHL